MEEMHLKQIDLVNVIGGKSRVSEVLGRKRKLTFLRLATVANPFVKVKNL